VAPTPEFLQLAGHPLRWHLLTELARSDRSVKELTESAGEPQNLVSYHLAKLRAAGLVRTRRSSKDRRDTYYAADLPRCTAALNEVGGALCLKQSTAAPQGRVLFLCTGNSARSQLAEALIRHATNGSVEAHSAGSHPKTLHPNAVRVAAEYGIDISHHRAKHLDRYAGQRFTAVVTLCDKVKEVCPEFPGHPERIHWSIPDPATAGATDEETYPAFRATAAELATRNRFLLHRLEAA
jgi:ArsR family transcriptional regulator, arsenate/arsenite/antimonite-responsive transcriptional repressor / arsenate reductase (thioredoxin)